MGHYCTICGRTRSNEKFSGKGHKKHICKDCSGKSPSKRNELNAELVIDLIDIDIFGEDEETRKKWELFDEELYMNGQSGDIDPIRDEDIPF